MQAVRQWREQDGLQAYFTIDAGPNIHMICEANDVKQLEAQLITLSSVERVIVSRPGDGPQYLNTHLF